MAGVPKGNFVSGIGTMLVGAGSEIIKKLPFGKGAAALTGFSIGTGAVGYSALQTEEALRGSDSVLGRAKQMEANSHAAMQSKGFWSSIKEGIANFLELIEKVFGKDDMFKDFKTRLRDTADRNPSGRTIGQDLSRAIGDSPVSALAMAAGPVAGLTGAVVAAKSFSKSSTNASPVVSATESFEEAAAKTKGKGWLGTVFKIGAGAAVAGGAIYASTREAKADEVAVKAKEPTPAPADDSILSSDNMRYGSMALGAGAIGAKLIGKRIPLAGALVTTGFVAAEVKDEWNKGNYGKMFGAAFAGAAEGVGNIVGFGVGDAAREVVRGGISYVAGEENAPLKSDIRQIAEAGVELVRGNSVPAPSLVPGGMR